MTWHTNELTPGNIVIQDDSRIVGSILKKDEKWHVEILWGIDDGDLIFEAAEYTTAIAYVQGVENAWAKVGMAYIELPVLHEEPVEGRDKRAEDIVRAVIGLLPDDRVRGLAVLDAARRMVERFKR